MEDKKAGLFGIKHSIRDFSKEKAWGKNQFNSSFPASLAAYMSSKGLKNKYLTIDKNLEIVRGEISTEELFGISPLSDNLYYAFEFPFSPYNTLVKGSSIPNVDLVTQQRDNNTCLKALEIKLTALPDNSTCNLSPDKFSCEIVIRPDTIVYLGCSIAINYKDKQEKLKKIMANKYHIIKDLKDPDKALSHIENIVTIIDAIAKENISNQEPLVLQPIWKTDGKKPILSNNCLDIFVWSNLALTRLFINVVKKELKDKKITRQIRSIIWLFKMLYDFSIEKQFNYAEIISDLSYNPRNDKAFSVNGKVTYKYLKCDELVKPRITKEQIKEIILGGGQKLLSPERRFDAIIFNSPDLFD